MNQKIYNAIPGIDYEEVQFLESITKELSEDQLETFVAIYNGKRQKPDMILIGGLIGLLGIGGVQRFMINQIGMGILFLLTFGLCYIGTIVDLVNYRRLASEHNQNQAYEAMQMAKSLS